MNWSPFASFTVSGEPKAQPRARAFAKPIGGGKFSARVYDPGTAEGWKGCICLAARDHVPPSPLSGPIRLDVDFLFPRPGRLKRRRDPQGRIWHKAVMDCLKTLGFLADDAVVCAGELRKFYVAIGERPGANIRISVPVVDELLVAACPGDLMVSGGHCG